MIHPHHISLTLFTGLALLLFVAFSLYFFYFLSKLFIYLLGIVLCSIASQMDCFECENEAERRTENTKERKKKLRKMRSKWFVMRFARSPKQWYLSQISNHTERHAVRECCLLLSTQFLYLCFCGWNEERRRKETICMSFVQVRFSLFRCIVSSLSLPLADVRTDICRRSRR